VTGNQGATGNTGPTGNPEDVTLTSTTGVSLVYNGTGPDLVLKGISATGITTVTDNGTDILINTPNTTLTNAGGITLVNDGVGPDLAVKGVAAGAGISLINSGTQVTVANVSNDVSLTSAGGAVSLVNDGVGPALAIKGLTSSGNITLTNNGTFITISASNAATPSGFFARLTANVAATAGTTITGSWSTATPGWTNGGGFNTGTGIFTVPATGLYYIAWNISTDSTIARSAVGLAGTGTPLLTSNIITNAVNGCAGGSAIVSLTAGQQYSLWVSANTTVYANVDNSATNPGTWFSVVRLV
jgi:hypothetical protein